MRAELVKRQDRWDLYAEDGSKIGSSAPNPMNKLSLKNCEAIEKGYDLDELAVEDCIIYPEHHAAVVKHYKRGFQKALEILGDKKFSADEIIKAYNDGWSLNYDYFQSLQQTEWDVSFNPDEKDSEGCLILKRL